MIDAILRPILTPQNISRIVNGMVVTLTGKHVFDHAVDAGSFVIERTAAYVKSLWKRLENWAKGYLSTHEDVLKVFLSATSIAASAKRAKDNGVKFVKVKIFHQTIHNARGKIIREEEVPLDQIDGVIRQAKSSPILAMRH